MWCLELPLKGGRLFALGISLDTQTFVSSSIDIFATAYWRGLLVFDLAAPDLRDAEVVADHRQTTPVGS